jgi:hypothetical protein
VLSVAIGMTTNETHWPQERDGMTIFAGPPFVPAPGYRTLTVIAPGGGSIPTGSVPYRCRIIGRSYTAQIKGLTIGPRNAPVMPPQCNLPSPFLNDNFNDVDARGDIPDPLYTYSPEKGNVDGWICRNYQRDGGEYAMGSVVMGFWTADYEYVRRKSL